MDKVKLNLRAVIVAILIGATPLLVWFLNQKPAAQEKPGAAGSCSALHSGLNSPLEKADCFLPNRRVLKLGESRDALRCDNGGRLSSTAKPACDTAHFTIASGTREQCERALSVSDCGVSTERYSACALLVAKDTEILRWSDARTWGGHAPQGGDNIVIPDGKIVILDIDSPPLSSLEVNGILLFDDKDVVLTAGAIYLGGAIQIGTPSAPFLHQARIHVIEPDQGLGITQGFYMVSGGQFDAHGARLAGAKYPWGSPRFSNIQLQVDGGDGQADE